MLVRYTTLVRNNDFARAYKRGKSFVHPFLVLYVNKNRAGCTRVGITCSKKIGNAVTRNRARRVIRHAMDATLPPSVGAYDLVFVARGQTAAQKSHAVAWALYQLLGKAGLPARRPPKPGTGGQKPAAMQGQQQPKKQQPEKTGTRVDGQLP